MNARIRLHFVIGLVTIGALVNSALLAAEPRPLTLHWEKNMLTINGEHVPGKEIKIWYLEAYCRAGSTDRDWKETVIPHTTEMISLSEDARKLRLKCTVSDGVIVEHTITTTAEEVDFRIAAHNPSDKPSEIHWAQPCLRVDRFTGRDKVTYLDKCFIFLDGKLERFPTRDWATQARYIPGQVWAPKGVDRNDVNPRPLSKLTPSNGLIGCFSHDDSMLLATSFEPYQELFQGIIACVHSDFRIGGLKPGEKKSVRGKLYVLKNDVPALLSRYRRDFPEHVEPRANRRDPR